MLGLSIELTGQSMIVPARECRRLLRIPGSLAEAISSGAIPERVVLEGSAYRLRFPQRTTGPLRVMRGSRLIQLECDPPTVVFIELVTGMIEYSAEVGSVVVDSGRDYLCSSLLSGDI